MASPSSSPPPLPPPPLALPPPPPSSSPDQNSDHHNDNPLTLTSSNPTSPLQAAAATSSPPKKSAPLPWTHQEAVNLIQAYQEKWYSLKRGQLKASQWEEVSVTVAARCGYDEPSKSATQCRHKIEKLRKRYRSEKQKTHPYSWPLFEFMDRLERGPLPISVRPIAMVEYQNPNSGESNKERSDSDDDDDNHGTYDCDRKRNKSRSINHLVRGGNHVNRPGLGNFRVLRNPILVQKREEVFENEEEDGDDEEDEEDNDDEEEEEEDGEDGELAEGLATEIRSFAERFVRMENKKIEMMRDTERFRMEMENKRMEMIIESQHKLVDTIHRAFASHKKMKMAQ